MQAAPSPPIDHVNQLLALHGAAFIAAVYGSLLGREPDPHGGGQYLARLLRDGDKVAILFDLAMSEEGFRHQHQIAGLKELVDSRMPARNWLSRFLNKTRRLEQSVTRTEATLSFLGNEMHARMRTLENLISQLSTARSEQECRILAEIKQLNLGLVSAGSSTDWDASLDGRGAARRLAHAIQPPPAGRQQTVVAAPTSAGADGLNPLSVEDLLSMAARIRMGSH